jgi:hypothetical protein
MPRLVVCSFCVMVILCPVRAGAEDTPREVTWQTDRSITLSPRPAHVPALRYRLLPLDSERKAGNASPIYLRFAQERSEQTKKDLREKPSKWNEMPISKLPREEVRKFLDGFRYQLEQLDLGARRKTCDWNYTLDVEDIFMILLPDAQEMRQYAHLLVLKARLEIADGHFPKAARTLETGFAFAQHLAEGPFLINGLIGLAVANQLADTVIDLIERTDSPNLYWSLTALPRPLIDLRKGLEFEQRILELQFPELTNLDRPRTVEEWDAGLKRVRQGMHTLIQTLGNSWGGKIRADSPLENLLVWAQTGAIAHRYLIETVGIAEKKLDAMPQSQVLLTYMGYQFQEIRDDWFKAAYLPFPEARPMLAESEKRLKEKKPKTEPVVFAEAFLPGLAKTKLSAARLERKIAALRVLEALRLHAAIKGRLPEKLDEVKVVPVPLDPVTGKPFEYSGDGNTATLISRIPGDPVATSGLRYQITLRK